MQTENASLLEVNQESKSAQKETSELDLLSSIKAANFLAEASILLAESLEYVEVFERVAQLIVRDLADYCQYDVVGIEGYYTKVAPHIPPQKKQLLDRILSAYPPDKNNNHPARKALISGEAILVDDLTSEFLNSYAINEEHATLTKELGTKSLLIVPLQTRGKILGVLTMAFIEESNRKYNYNDLYLAKELAKRAAFAIDNALLYKKAQTDIRSREDFISIASHELKTPITSLKIQIQFLLKIIASNHVNINGPKANRVTGLIQEADEQVSRLTKLISVMLDVSQINTGSDISLNREEFNLNLMIAEILMRLKPELEQSSCSVDINFCEEIIGNWDKIRIEQVITNLITNAIKYGAGMPISITTQIKDDHLLLTVKDNGIGIAKEDHSRIFGRFERAVSITKFGGLGLGLYITQQIVKSHDGEIWVESDYGHGAAFIVKLPLKVNETTSLM